MEAFYSPYSLSGDRLGLNGAQLLKYFIVYSNYSYIHWINSTISDRFFRARCNCSGNSVGEFCEQEFDPCTDISCGSGNVTCDSSAENPCADCEDGYERGEKGCISKTYASKSTLNIIYNIGFLTSAKGTCSSLDLLVSLFCEHNFAKQSCVFFFTTTI